MDSGSRFWALDQDDFRIDGKALAPSGRIGPGLVSTIAPDGIWRGIVELRQAEPKTGYAVALGADTRKALVLPLSPGRHTIAVRCGDTWSADVPFYWERWLDAPGFGTTWISNSFGQFLPVTNRRWLAGS